MKIRLLIALSLATTSLFAQNELEKCTTSAFVFPADSTTEWNPVTAWRDCMVGKTIPSFSARTMTGELFTNETVRNRIMVLSVWMINCHPCIEELPALNKLLDEYKPKGVVFLSITPDNLTVLERDFFPKFKQAFPVVTEAHDLIKKFGGSGYPKLFVVDAKGVINEFWPGGPMNEKDKSDMYLNAKPVLDKLLQKAGQN